jgi:hypothetical protein
MEGSCEHGNEPSGFIICWEILECLRHCWLLKKGSAQWSCLVMFQSHEHSLFGVVCRPSYFLL